MPEILTDDHAVGDDLDRAAPVGEQLGDRRGLVEAELVDDHHPPVRVGPALEHVAHVDHPRVVAAPTTAGPGRAPVARTTTSGPSAASTSAASTSTPVRHVDARAGGPARPGCGRGRTNSARLGTLAATRTWPPRRSLALVEDDPVPALGRRHRGLQAAGPAADDDHPPPGRAGAAAARRPPPARSAGSRCSRATG